jgi:hypothetical protein
VCLFIPKVCLGSPCRQMLQNLLVLPVSLSRNHTLFNQGSRFSLCTLGQPRLLHLTLPSLHPMSGPGPASTLAAASGSPSSSFFPPALLAFILVIVYIFMLGMIFALYRIYGKQESRISPASPTFLEDATARNSGHHRATAIALNESRASILKRDLDNKGAIKWESLVERDPSKRGAGIIEGCIPNDVPAPHDPKPPFSTHVAVGYNASPSRVLRPNAPRFYHRPHPAYRRPRNSKAIDRKQQSEQCRQLLQEWIYHAQA